MINKITVVEFHLNELGIKIAYKLDGTTYYFIALPDQVEGVLATIGNTVADGLSQHDAILIAAAHEEEKKANVIRLNYQSQMEEFLIENFLKP